jgi:glycosyltransferase involved in cell wall biosynthesis
MTTVTPQTKFPKILHVVLSMVVGGAEKLVYDMVRYPVFAENRPVVACLDSMGELGGILRQKGYMVYCKGRSEGLEPGVIPWLLGIMRREKVTVVHAHQYTPLFYAVPAALLAGRIKVIYTEHGRFHPDRSSWKRRLFNPLLSLGVAHLVSISEATAKAMVEFDNFPASRIKVIHNGVDFSRMNPPVDLAGKRRELGLSDTCRIVGTAARLEEIKNIPMMFRVFKLVLQAAPDTCLLVAGQGSQTENLKCLAVELGIAERVKFVGLRLDMPEIYQLFDVFLLTSFTEGISVTLLEAMATGVPVVVTDVGGNQEVVVEGEAGWLVPVDDDVAMSERILGLLGNTSLARVVGVTGRERVHTLFSFDGMLELYCTTCYTSLAPEMD